MTRSKAVEEHKEMPRNDEIHKRYKDERKRLTKEYKERLKYIKENKDIIFDPDINPDLTYETFSVPYRSPYTPFETYTSEPDTGYCSKCGGAKVSRWCGNLLFWADYVYVAQDVILIGTILITTRM